MPVTPVTDWGQAIMTSVAALALALGLAFGLGGRETAGQIVSG